MDDPETVTLTRRQLYDMVWATPMVRLAKTLHLSDVGLAKTCRKHRIPYPPRGYWEKKWHGKPVRQPPLPPCNDPNLQSVRFVKRNPQPAPPAEPMTSPTYDEDVLEVLERARALGSVQVKADLRNPHPLVRSTRDGLGRATPDQHNLLFPEQEARVPYVTRALENAPGPIVAVSDWMRAVPDQIAQWVPGDYTSLGADGFGFADTRGAARRFFHIDAESVVVAVLSQLAKRGEVKREAISEAINRYQLHDVKAAGAGPTGGDA